MTKKSRQEYTEQEYSEVDQAGLNITREQVSDTLAEGTFDAKVDEVDGNGALKTHRGESISQTGYAQNKRRGTGNEQKK
ncbi:YozQ family protein [Halobacillus salinarum]|uniref:YozQ family protein n=1 Tax=Halobacillus salinarum TaxID=2932257 RepID=A0ABY4ENG1_9BACI|nr:YozQ family protein [Halobacillus salinarum]UOQ45999.1 YozQ family protein [Halobacillus salinarum]